MILKNPDVEFDPEALKKYITSLYIGRGQTKFKKDETPFFVIFIKVDNNVCIRLTTRGRKNIERIEKINKTIPSSKLKWHGLELSKPYEWVLKQQTWWDEETKKKTGGEKWVSIIQQGPYFYSSRRSL